MEQAVELIRFRVSEDRTAQFLEQRMQVDEALKTLTGFVNSELLQVSDEQWLAIIRWNSRADAVAAQAVTADMQIITDWIALANEFLSFDTADVRYVSR